MTSGRLESKRFRIDDAHPRAAAPTYSVEPRPAGRVSAADGPVESALAAAREYLLAQQAPEGYWVGELEGDTILESEYLFLLAFLGREGTERARECANYLLEKQLPDGGWAVYPGGPIEISSSVKAYLSLKLVGHPRDAESMVRAREAIIRAGGVEQVNSFTRYYLALLGFIPYECCPAVPPEMILLPTWAPFNIYEMSAWSRTIVVPLSLLWAFQPVRHLPEEFGIGELMAHPDRKFPLVGGGFNNEARRETRVDWARIFQRLDLCIKGLERRGIRPLRKLAVRRAERWILERLQDSDGLGAIFPPIIWSIIALKCLGYADDSPEVTAQLSELDRLAIRDGNTVHLQPCLSPVWDTAISLVALREAGVPARHPCVQKGVSWLLSKEVRSPGDWAVKHPGRAPGGWFFEFNNRFYPDVDDTSMVLLALAKCLPGSTGDDGRSTELLHDAGPRSGSDQVDALLTSRGESLQSTFAELQALRPVFDAVRRGVKWIRTLQSRDGGWGAFDSDNNRELLTRVPFADHNAMIDPSTADITARVVEMLAAVGASPQEPFVRRAIEFIWNDQQEDGAWYGRWGVNYIYGTWQVLVGLDGMGVPSTDSRVRRAAEWLKSKQQSCGGWGETCGSYDDPALRGTGEPTASQTSWAVLGLMAAGDVHSEAVKRGIAWLVSRQTDEGTWEEDQFTGTGFPRVFYLKYHLYRHYFPLLALGRYQRLTARY